LGNGDLPTRLLALETIGAFGGQETVERWWADEGEAAGPEGIELLAKLWDRGIKVVPARGEDRWLMYRALLGNRLWQRRMYLLRWVLYGAVGSALTSVVASFLGLELAIDAPGAVLTSVLSGLGLGIGLSLGELFEGGWRGLVRILGSVVTVYSAGWLASLVVRSSQGRTITFLSTAMASSALYTLAAGIGTTIGQLWPRRSNLGYLVGGSLAVIGMQRLLEWPLGALISLGVVLGTGVAQVLERERHL
jgi:hypothetical protein